MTAVYFINDAKKISYNRHNQITPVEEIDLSEARIEIEKNPQELNSEKRHKAFIKILENKKGEGLFWQTLIHGCLKVLVPVLFIMPFTLIPAHNVFEEPKYWYEYPLLVLFVYMPQSVAFIIMNCSFWMNIEYIRKPRHFLAIGLLGMFDVLFLYPIGFMIWTNVLGYRYPIPFNSALNFYIVTITFYLALWFRFPKEWRQNKEFRRRLKWFIIAITFNQFIPVQYSIIAKLFVVFQDHNQWIIAIFLPLVREFNIWLNLKLALKSNSGDNESVFITCTYNLSTKHSLFLAYTVGSRATPLTNYIVLAEDFLINIYICIKLIWIRKKHSAGATSQIELLQELLINELVEFLVPFEYVLCLITAYYGPNASLFGDVGSSYWQYSAIDDINHTLKTIFTLFSIDICSLLACSIFLWYFCQINVYRVYAVLQKEFGVVFLVNLVYIMSSVSKGHN